MSTRLIVPVCLFALGLSSCGGASAEEVAPFEEIAVSGPHVEPDRSGEAAVLTVETSIDAICAVSYGIGDPVGDIATDTQMEPEGHSEHRVTLSGLRPGTQYSYRLQGVGSDGRLYRSEVLTFSTPEAPRSAIGRNLAEGAEILEVSSEFSSSFAAANAVDGDVGTEWSTAGDGDDAFVTIDLGTEAEVDAVLFRTRRMSDGSAITRTFTVTIDEDETLGPFAAGPEPVDVSFRGRVLRFDVEESSGGNTGAVEIEVYEPAGG